jgi:hypothetical protein
MTLTDRRLRAESSCAVDNTVWRQLTTFMLNIFWFSLVYVTSGGSHHHDASGYPAGPPVTLCCWENQREVTAWVHTAHGPQQPCIHWHHASIYFIFICRNYRHIYQDLLLKCHTFGIVSYFKDDNWSRMISHGLYWQPVNLGKKQL